jgi:ADP-ribose pyrophosphatase YjhB (NUDIX family)
MSGNAEKFVISTQLLCISNDCVLLQWKNGKWGFPGGKADKKKKGVWETPKQALKRELREETGIIVCQKHLIPLTTVHRGDSESPKITIIFTTSAWKKGPSRRRTPSGTRPLREEDCYWFSMNALPQDTVYLTREVLKMKRSDTLPVYFELGKFPGRIR